MTIGQFEKFVTYSDFAIFSTKAVVKTVVK